MLDSAGHSASPQFSLLWRPLQGPLSSACSCRPMSFVSSVPTTLTMPPVGRASWRAVLANRLVASGLSIIGALVLIALCAGVAAPHDPAEQYADGLDEDGMPLPPSLRFPLGTDSLGRIVLSRTLHGSRISLAVGGQIGRA